jgi:DNA-binding NtrC family response regulator
MVSSRTILLFEPDNDTRPILIENLRNQGFQVVTALDQADILQRAMNQDRIDLILINQTDLSMDECVVLAQQTRYHHNADENSQIPAVIIAEHYGEDLEGQNIQIGDFDFVTYLTDGQQLFDFLKELCDPN